MYATTHLVIGLRPRAGNGLAVFGWATDRAGMVSSAVCFVNTKTKPLMWHSIAECFHVKIQGPSSSKHIIQKKSTFGADFGVVASSAPSSSKTTVGRR